jgi:hypothetical protein
VPSSSGRPGHHCRWRFLRARRKELTPNQAKATVKQAEIARRLEVVSSARYLAYSRTSVVAPKRAIARNKVPVTSNQSWCAAWPKERRVAFVPLQMAFNVRFRPACRLATRAATPSFCRFETLVTASILSASGATVTQLLGAKRFGDRGHLRLRGNRWIRNSNNS